MLVKNWMSKPVITIDENDSMEKVIALLKENNIEMMPVMEKDKLVGVVTDRDLKKNLTFSGGSPIDKDKNNN